ncbi:MAG: hypothetical protein GXO30_02640, partial [Epsilonproteobacteria bacterium]|nr:hypothetical protein [Campylobacterota bacterium]
MLQKVIKYFKDVKAIVPVIVLLFIVFWLTYNLLSVEFEENSTLNKLKKNIYLTTEISLLMHEIQRERGMSVGFIISNGKNFKKELYAQRKSTNIMLNNLKDDSYKEKPVSKSIQEKIGYIRSSVDSIALETNEVVECYTKMNTLLLDMVIAI